MMQAASYAPVEHSEQHQVVPGVDDKDTPIFAVLVKRTYRIVPNAAATRLEAARPFTLSDQYYPPGSPETCSVEHESDLAPFKPATDVVINATAYAPSGAPTQVMDVSVDVAGHRKSIRVIGDRQCQYTGDQVPAVTAPVPFTQMPIRYEYAYGGRDSVSHPDLPVVYPRNYIGKGFVIKNSRETVDGLALPNLEDPENTLRAERIVLNDPSEWNAQPIPQGFGWYSKMSYPRSFFAGVTPGFVSAGQATREEELGWVPKDHIGLARQFKLPTFTARFSNGASPFLILPYLSGTESLRLTGLTPGGQLSFTLPGDRPRIKLNIGLGDNELEVVLHTVVVRVDDGEVDLVWRGAHEYPGTQWLPDMKRLDVEIV